MWTEFDRAAKALAAAKQAFDDLADAARKEGFDRLASEIDGYTVGILRNFMVNDLQPGSLPSIRACMDEGEE